MPRVALLIATLLLALGGTIAPHAVAAGEPASKNSAAKKKAAAKKKTAAKRRAAAKRCAKKKTRAKRAACRRALARKRPAKKKVKAPLGAGHGAPSAAPPAPAPAPPPAPAPSPAPAPPPSPSPAPVPRPGVPFDFTAPPNPVTVDGTADTARAKSAWIDHQGGTVEATGANGARYRLTIPEHALIDTTRITVTPLSGVSGLPFAGGLRAGAQLEPHGLRFMKAAKLEIIGGPAIDPALETGFAYHGDGQDLHLTPMVRDPAERAFTIQHFSSYGIAHGTDAERRAQLIRTTESTERRLEQIVAYEIGRDRALRLGLPGGAELRHEVIEGAIRSYHDQVLGPLMDAALTDDDVVGRAINRYLLWDRTANLMTEDEFMLAERRARHEQFKQVMLGAAERAYARCMAGNIGELPALISWNRQLVVLGIEMPLQDMMRKCARFELDFETDILQLGGFFMPEGPERWRGRLEAQDVQLVFQDDWRIYGTGQFDYGTFSVEIPPHEPGTGCWQGGGDWERSGLFMVSDLHADFNWVENVDGDQYQLMTSDVVDWRLTMPPLPTREFIFNSDCGGGTGPIGWTTWLGIVLQELHADEERTTMHEFTGWQPTGPSTWTSSTERTVTLDGYPTTESTQLTLEHVPDPDA